MAPRLLLPLLLCSVAAHSAAAFGFTEPPAVTDGNVIQRRRFLQSTAALTAASWAGQSPSTPWLSPAAAEDAVAAEVPMKMFVDNANPSLFAIEVPKRFFAIRRSAKGDLPDAKTGKGE